MNRSFVAVLVAVSAMLALPAYSSASPAHLDSTPEGGFTLHGGLSQLSRVGGGSMFSTTTTGTGFFENTTSGKVTLTFHHLTNSLGTTCTSAGKPAGTVTTTELPFHLIMLESTPGILITSEEGHFATFACGVFIPTVHVRGNGVLGTFTSPECGKQAATATLSFKGSEGVQEHLTWTGQKFTRETSLGGAFSESAITAESTIAIGGGQTATFICT